MLSAPNTSLEAARERAQELLERDHRWYEWDSRDQRNLHWLLRAQVAAWHLNEAVKISQAYDDQNITMKEFFLAGESGSYWYHRGELQAHLDAADHFANLGG